MCRWLAYSGSPLLLEEFLYKPQFSLVNQSLHSRLGVEPTNGDGFGVGWYGVDGSITPATFRGVGPAWGDQNLREIAAHISSPLFLAHIRASTGTPVQHTNSHPFRHDRWLWVHNGAIRDFPLLKRELVLAVEPDLYPFIAGSTDSEVMFYLALTFGLREDPVVAVQRMVGFVEATGRRQGVQYPIQMSVATTDGERLWAFRYSSEGNSRSLFFSTDVTALRQLHPEVEALHHLSDEARLIVSEPLGELVGAWQPVPESTYGIVQKGPDVLAPFRPIEP
ncbi:class II glutamine amidotransferase [Actinoplanes sp. NPDC049118]|uniref:class II glutamine amidotransferase n=1 Tax=Actinoplanes sp. NPDC049118 TaxID=3155769 RepID=UPI0033DA8371